MAEIVRDKTLDGLKFFLVILVVVGHAIEPSRYSDDYSITLYSVIYSFHMPLFVVLSGYFSHKIISNSLQQINKHAICLVETYFVMALSIGLLLGYGLKLVISPSLSCWYLLSLVFWRYMLYWLVKKRKLEKMKLLFVSFLFMLITFFLPIQHYLGFMSLMRTCQFFPFFVIGYCFSERFILELRNNRNYKCYLSLMSFVIFLGLIAYSSRNLYVLEFHKDTLSSLITQFNWTPFQTVIYKSLAIFISLIICFSLLSVRHFPPVFEKYGRYTLSFFFLQGVIVHKLVMLLPANLFVELLVSIGLIILGGAVCDKLSWLMNPISTYIKRKNNE